MEDRHLAHMRPDALERATTWRGFVGSDTLPGLTVRIRRIVVPGRSFVLSETTSKSRPARVEQGMCLFVGGFRDPIEEFCGEFGAGVSVTMGPQIGGFGLSCDRNVDVGLSSGDPNARSRPLTSVEVHAALTREEFPPQFDWTWVEITGGLQEGRCLPADRISIVRRNKHGYRVVVDVVAADLAWQQRYERDALTADLIAKSLKAAGDERSAAAVAAVAARIRTDCEPLSEQEVYPVVSFG